MGFYFRFLFSIQQLNSNGTTRDKNEKYQANKNLPPPHATHTTPRVGL